MFGFGVWICCGLYPPPGPLLPSSGLGLLATPHGLWEGPGPDSGVGVMGARMARAICTGLRRVATGARHITRDQREPSPTEWDMGPRWFLLRFGCGVDVTGVRELRSAAQQSGFLTGHDRRPPTSRSAE